MGSFWTRVFRSKDREAYKDDKGRPRTEGGFLIDKQFGDNDFRRDFTRQPGWIAREDWYRGSLEEFEEYDCGRNGVIYQFDQMHTDPRYFERAGDPVDDYDGPYVTENVVKVLRRRGVIVPPWAILRPASHSDQRIQYPGYSGSPPESYGATWTWKRGLRPHKSVR